MGCTVQAKNENSTNGQARWPKKSAVFLLNLLKNAESNAEVRRHSRRPYAALHGESVPFMLRLYPYKCHAALCCYATSRLC